MSTFEEPSLQQLDGALNSFGATGAPTMEELERLYDIPVTVSAVLGHTRLPVGELLRLGPGMLLELDRKVGEAIDIRVNDRLVGRLSGELVAASRIAMNRGAARPTRCRRPCRCCAAAARTSS